MRFLKREPSLDIWYAIQLLALNYHSIKVCYHFPATVQVRQHAIYVEAALDYDTTHWTRNRANPLDSKSKPHSYIISFPHLMRQSVYFSSLQLYMQPVPPT